MLRIQYSEGMSLQLLPPVGKIQPIQAQQEKLYCEIFLYLHSIFIERVISLLN